MSESVVTDDGNISLVPVDWDTVIFVDFDEGFEIFSGHFFAITKSHSKRSFKGCGFFNVLIYGRLSIPGQ